jgi:hypothetical protein
MAARTVVGPGMEEARRRVGTAIQGLRLIMAALQASVAEEVVAVVQHRIDQRPHPRRPQATGHRRDRITDNRGTSSPFRRIHTAVAPGQRRKEGGIIRRAFRDSSLPISEGAKVLAARLVERRTLPPSDPFSSFPRPLLVAFLSLKYIHPLYVALNAVIRLSALNVAREIKNVDYFCNALQLWIAVSCAF